uniref:Secreted protein n=1 Tax=Anopheles culicifacies TaxID=139723 RepID=A0A182M3V2_9DIPT
MLSVFCAGIALFGRTVAVFVGPAVLQAEVGANEGSLLFPPTPVSRSSSGADGGLERDSLAIDVFSPASSRASGEEDVECDATPWVMDDAPRGPAWLRKRQIFKPLQKRSNERCPFGGVTLRRLSMTPRAERAPKYPEQ